MPIPDDYDFPLVYSDGMLQWWTSGSWDKYTDAADHLDVVKSHRGVYSLQKRLNSPSFTRCHGGLVSSKLRLVGECSTVRCQGCEDCQIPYSDITKADIRNFQLLFVQASKDLELFEKYFAPDIETAIIQHDSTVENVMDRLPLRYINNAQQPFFRPLLERLISLAKKLHEEKLYDEYTLFLTNCDRIKIIKTHTTAAECLETLKDDPHFLANKFGDLESHRLQHGMQMYLNYRKAMVHYIKYFLAQMKDEYQYQRVVMLKDRGRLPEEFLNPIHFLAFQKRHKGYHLQHPLKEIMKCRAYFAIFIDGVPPPWRPEPGQVGSSPSLERPKKRARHL